MRYVGGQHDEFEDDDEQEDDDELRYEDVDDDYSDDEESSASRSQSRVNPFTGSSPARSSSNLPGAGRVTGAPPSSGGGLASRLPGSVGPQQNRPASPPASSSSSPSGGSQFGNRPASSPGGSPPPGGARPASSPFSSGGSGSSSGSSFGNRPASSSPFSGSGSQGSSPGSGSGGSSFGNRPASGSPPTSGGSSFGNRPATSSPFGGSSSSPSSPGARPSSPSSPGKGEEQKSGGLFGGRLGGGDKKPASPTSRPSDSGKGGPLSGLTSRFSGGGDKPATPKSSGSGGGLLGGLTGRFGGKKEAPKLGATSSASPFASRTSSGAMPMGGSSARPSASDSGKSSLFGRPFGRLGGGGTASSARSSNAQSQRTGIGRFLPFLGGGGAAAAPAVSQPARQRASKAPRVESGGLSLDNKLDILGVALVLGALALFFSRMSATKGALTEWANNLITTTFGWGALAIPVAMLAVGIWLIARHFGEQAPVVPRNRIFGIILTYVGALILLQFIDSFSYVDLQTGAAPDLLTLRRIYLPLAVSRGTGGGSIGAELYYLLVSNFTEYGAFFMMALVLIVGIMFTLDIGAAQLAMVIVGNVRGLGDAWQRRAQDRRARVAEAALQQLTAPGGVPSITVSKPAEALPAPGTPVLPSPIEAALPMGQPVRAERPIAIRVGGQKLGENQPAQGQGASANASTQGAPRGGFGSRLRGALPFPGKPASPPETLAGTEKSALATTAAAAAVGGIRGLFSRGGDGKKVESPAPEKVVTPSPVTALPASLLSPAPEKPAESPTRLGELLRPTSEAAGQPGVASTAPAPFTKPATPSPSSPITGRRATSEQPRVGGVPASGAPGSSPVRLPVPPSVVRTPTGKPEDDMGSMVSPAPARPAASQLPPRSDALRAPISHKPGTVQPAAPDRNSRLNELRSGGTPAEKPVTGAPARVTPFGDGPLAGQPPASRPAAASVTPEKPTASLGPAGARPAEPVQSPSSAFGKPDTPPPLAGGLRGGEIPVRQPGVGTSAPTNVPRKRKEWKLPNISTVLMPGSEGDFDREMLLRRARIIEDTLQSFGAPGKVVEVNTGPVITQFGVEPDYLTTRGGKKNRVKVSAIAQLDKDIQLALGAKSIRIEAPVPGKGYVGIEVPNDTPSLVSLRDVMEAESFKKIKSPLAIALGQAVDGTPISADLTSMPHLLIAGTTGSGKSVCVNAIITSLVIQNQPDRVKFIMVDPKRVELTGYNGLPHLVAPVVVELERIVGVLKWVTREMDERYKRFSVAGARNIEDFNKHLVDDAEPMPYIVVIIDELADLMMLAPDETERVITRIAALARATGIHLVIATQRPSVDVVTGLIKANFPARIAFAVAGGVDSRVILDQPGAERLLGRGDMLYMSGDSPAPLRLQGVYVSDNEIDNIVRYWKQQVTPDDLPARPIPALVVDNSVAEPSLQATNGSERSQSQQAFWDKDERSNVTSFGSDDDNDNVSVDQDDELYEEAVEMVRRLNKASVSLLQRRLRIGYTRAARLIDRMEEEGIVGPAVEGSKPRDVIG